jgi:hypothetical protein
MWLRSLALALFAAILCSAGTLAAEEKSLLSADGTLYAVRAGLAADLGVSGEIGSPEDYVIEWSFRRQDGATGVGIIAGTVNRNTKKNLDLAFDDETGTLLLLWKEEFSALNEIRIGMLREGTWATYELVPNAGFSLSFNPRMLITHQTVRYVGPAGEPATRTRSILSVLWWEEAHTAQARYAPIFLDENVLELGAVQVYDLPVLVGSEGATALGEYPDGAYLYPALSSDGPGGGILASFADLTADRHHVVRITFPDDLGDPADPGNLTWQRRHIPIVGIVGSGPIAQQAPSTLSVGTAIGSAYRPTLHWRDGNALRYTRFDGRAWSAAISIPLTETMSYEKALELVLGMATRN